MTPEQQKAAGNEAFKRRDYHEALRHYDNALEGVQAAASAQLDSDDAQEHTFAEQTLWITVLANRSLVHYRLGSYAAAIVDAQEVLHLYPMHRKTAFRLAAALLQLGDVTGAVRATQVVPFEDDAARGQMPAGWDALRLHAYARLAHEQRKQVDSQGATKHVQAVLWELEAEADGEAEDADPAALMQQLATLLSPSNTSSGKEAAAAVAAALEAPGCRVYQLLLFHLAGPSSNCGQAATEALKAVARAAGAGSSAVLWPALVWQRLVAMATDCSCSSDSAAAVMQLLRWAAARDDFVRQQLLLHPLLAPAGGAPDSSPLEQILAVLADGKRLQQLSPAAVVAAAQLLRQHACDAASTDALLACRPLLVLLRVAAAAEQMSAFRLDGDSRDDSGGTAGNQADQGESSLVRNSSGRATHNSPQQGHGAGSSLSKAEVEQQALERLRQRRQQVFISELVELRRVVLGAALELAASSKDLLLAEAVEEKRGSTHGSKRTVTSGAFLLELLAFVRLLHEQQPRRTSPVLGHDGVAKTYEKRRYAADFKDNPLGDFLVSMDLADDGGLPTAATPAGLEAAGGGATLLELALALLLRTAAASGSTAAMLYRKKLFALCEELCSYCTPSVVAVALQLYAVAADRVAAAAEELLQCAAVPPKAALFLHSTQQQHRLKALDRLAAEANTCSGDEFALLTADQASTVYAAWQVASAGAQEMGHMAASGSYALQQAARKLLLLCCWRAQRQQRLVPMAPPRGGAWVAIGHKPLKQLLKEQHRQVAQQAKLEDNARFEHLKRGFFGKAPAAAAVAPSARRVAPQPAAAIQASTIKPPTTAPLDAGGSSYSDGVHGSQNGTVAQVYKSGAVVIHELPSAPASEPAVATTPQQLLRPDTCSTDPSEEEGEWEEELPDLRYTFDSSSSLAAEQRQVRAEWMAITMDKKVRWNQTDLDLSVIVAVPQGTRAADVQVVARYDYLTVSLKWFGRVVGGPLHRRVKGNEMHWCLEEQEVHVLMCKADRAWWRALFDGRLEKSYIEMLREEGHTAADLLAQPHIRLDDSTRVLVASIQERQAYIKAGLIDPVTTEDFALLQG